MTAMDQMQQAVFKLIDQHQNLEALLSETVDENVTVSNTSEVPIPVSVECASSVVPKRSQHLSIDACLACIQARAHVTGTPVPVIAASECVEEIRRLLQLHQDVRSEEKNLEYVVSLVKTLSSKQLLNKNLFIENLSSKVDSLPLELLWQLHSCSAIPLDRFVMCNLGHSTVLQNLAKNMTDLYQKADTEDRSVMKRDFLEVLVKYGYSEDSLDPRLVETSQEMLDWIVMELYKSQSQLSDEPCNHLVGNLFELVRCHPVLDQETVKRFFKTQMCNLLPWNPDGNVTTAITKQHSHWTYAKAPQAVVAMFKQLLLALDNVQICPLLEKVIEGQKVNWQHILVLVSVFCVCFRNGPSTIKALVSSLLKESLESNCLFVLHAAFLLARQAAAEGSHDFPSYAQWFQNQFGSPSAVHASSTKTITVFVSFLNGLVPYEPVQCLKAHVQHPPYAPPKSREDLMDYIALAKTRLADFKESWQTDDFAHSSTENRLQNKVTMDEVEIAVTTFEKTGRVQERVLQASIFRRPYYMGQFLRTLLIPRMLPDIPDSKMKFIEALKSADKIPSLMYNKYTEACAAELRILLEGVSSEDMDDMTIEPMGRLREYVESLPRLLIKGSSHRTSEYDDIARHVALLSGRLTTVLEQLDVKPVSVSNTEGTRHIVLEIHGETYIDPSIMQVIDMLLTCFCKTHELLIKAKRPTAIVTDNFASLFATQGMLYHPLYHRLFTIICHQGDVLSEEHIAALAALLVHINALGERMPTVKLQTHYRHRCEHDERQSEPDQMSVLNLICREIDHCTGDEMKFALRFCKACLSSASELSRSSQNDCIPSELKKKHAYLQSRLQPASHPEFIPTSSQFNTLLMSKNVLSASGTSSNEKQGCPSRLDTESSLAEWVHMELRIHVCQDALTQMQRKRYHHWALYTQFLSRLAQSTSDKESSIAVYVNASTVILNVLLDCLREPASLSTMEYCPHEARSSQGGNRANDCSASCQEIIQLLQELLAVWPAPVHQNDPSIGPDCPWLLQVFTARLQRLSQAASGEDSNQCLQLEAGLEVANQITLAQSLAPHLLLTNCLQNDPTEADLKHLANYINMHLREHLQEDFCTLSFDAVALILKGIVQLCSHTVHIGTDRSNMVAMLATLLPESQLLTVSILRHWDLLNPLIVQLRETNLQQSVALTVLDHLHTFVNEVCSSKSGNTTASTHSLHYLASQPWTLMIIVVHAMTVQHAKQEVPVSIFQERLISRLELLFHKDDTRQHLFEYYVALTAWLIVTCPVQRDRVDALCSMAATELSKQPGTIMAAKGDTVLKKFFLQEAVVNLYPVVCFRILQTSQCHVVLQQASMNAGQLSSLLQLYTFLEQLHCRVEQPITGHPGRLGTSDQYQIINLGFLQSCQSMLQSVISRSTAQTLSSIDPAAYANYNPEIRSMIVHKMQPRQ